MLFNKTDGRLTKQNYFFCQRCAQECHAKPIMKKHTASGVKIKICPDCNKQLFLIEKQTSSYPTFA